VLSTTPTISLLAVAPTRITQIHSFAVPEVWLPLLLLSPLVLAVVAQDSTHPPNLAALQMTEAVARPTTPPLRSAVTATLSPSLELRTHAVVTTKFMTHQLIFVATATDSSRQLPPSLAVAAQPMSSVSTRAVRIPPPSSSVLQLVL
jgi:hypothetical protein